MSKITLLAGLIAMAILNTSVHAEDKPVQQLKAFLKNTKSLSADFKQVLINEAGNPTQTSFGAFYLQKPGKFRWDYVKPFQQQIVSTSGRTSGSSMNTISSF